MMCPTKSVSLSRLNTRKDGGDDDDKDDRRGKRERRERKI
jgi:hypothetical protein